MPGREGSAFWLPHFICLILFPKRRGLMELSTQYSRKLIASEKVTRCFKHYKWCYSMNLNSAPEFFLWLFVSETCKTFSEEEFSHFSRTHIPCRFVLSTVCLRFFRHFRRDDRNAATTSTPRRKGCPLQLPPIRMPGTTWKQGIHLWLAQCMRILRDRLLRQPVDFSLIASEVFSRSTFLGGWDQ